MLKNLFHGFRRQPTTNQFKPTVDCLEGRDLMDAGAWSSGLSLLRPDPAPAFASTTRPEILIFGKGLDAAQPAAASPSSTIQDLGDGRFRVQGPAAQEILRQNFGQTSDGRVYTSNPGGALNGRIAVFAGNDVQLPDGRRVLSGDNPVIILQGPPVVVSRPGVSLGSTPPTTATTPSTDAPELRNSIADIVALEAFRERNNESTPPTVATTPSTDAPELRGRIADFVALDALRERINEEDRQAEERRRVEPNLPPVKDFMPSVPTPPPPVFLPPLPNAPPQSPPTVPGPQSMFVPIGVTPAPMELICVPM